MFSSPVSTAKINKKQTQQVLSYLLLTSSLLIFPLQANPQKEPVSPKEQNQAHMQNIAQPNWWKKNNNNKVPVMASKKGATDFSKIKSEPASNFLRIPKNSEWQIISGSIGVSSVKYQLNHKGEHYELAVIRMNNKVPFDSIMNIWKNKVGLAVNSPTTAINLATKHKQKLKLYKLVGSQKSILLATHQQEKYTFFRLLGNNATESGLSKQVVDKFNHFLMTMEIIR